ncbi:Uncharacterised protein [Chryseobacterium taklimakanense]|uniref:Uncharacterized protein n=1 Tax=Chryseobacterium taklimakanense TaxID=536441 RepID=A0A239WDH1_9FLAO|nr:hypothetical protein [Chryseobacterium taklimakanense]SNV31968.1 Uncharacterised protein [Chryseobacterium taklimakanense]
MKESIFDIAKAIDRHRQLEFASETLNNAVGRCKVLYDGTEQQFWLINSEGNVKTSKDWFGNPIANTAFVDAKPYSKDGFTVPKHSYLASILIQNNEGSHAYRSPNGEKIIEIFNRATYDPSPSAVAENIKINIASDSRKYAYQLISEILELKKSLEKDEKAIEEAKNKENQEAVDKLILELDLKRKQFDEKLASAKNFIRTHAELRYQPILDPVQDKVKSSKIFNGNLIINGGPGTGKTTSLIQRIKFLTSQTIEEFTNISSAQRQVLFDQKKSWIFFTPNELLKLFLNNSMVKEELLANDDTVRVWQDYKPYLFLEFKLSDSVKKKPFLFYKRDQDITMLPEDAAKLQELISKFEKYFISLQKQKLDKIKNLDISLFSWKDVGNTIKRDSVGNADIDIPGFMLLFLNLQEKYQDLSKSVADDFNKMIQRAAAIVLTEVKKDTARYQELVKMIASENLTETDNEQDEDEDIDRENFEETVEENPADTDLKLIAVIKSLVRKNALKKFDNITKLTGRDKKYLEKIPESQEVVNGDKIGEIAFFRKYFERLTKGIMVNIYQEIPSAYKKFRRSEIASQSVLWNFSLLEKLVKENNIRLHVDEQAFIIMFINKLNNLLAKNHRLLYNNTNHPFVETFRQYCKAVIGIDEATDFRLIDLLCMSSFNNPDFNSVTLSGDMMQKLTKDGLKSWDDYRKFFKDTEIYDLEISYRQSQTLLALAQIIYKGVNKQEAVYKSFISPSDMEPVPLLLISDDEDEKLQWIVNRILEIRAAYSFIPSIAIFVPLEQDVERCAKKLGDFDELSDVGINVKACKDGEVLGNKDTVRVFSIDKIKGLEFEAAFFHNVDNILRSDVSDEMFLKFMYVGLSRASFYLAMTLNDNLPEKVSAIQDYFKTEQNWK